MRDSGADSGDRQGFQRAARGNAETFAADAHRKSRSTTRMVRRLGRGSARATTPARVASVRPLSEPPDHASPDSESLRCREENSRVAWRCRNGLESRMEDQLLGTPA